MKAILLFLCAFSYAVPQSKFLLLMGPSGVGKSSIIRHLKALDSRFLYVTPLTTRELRKGEQDKIHATREEIQELEKAGKLLTVNEIYGIQYATPSYLIDDAFEKGLFPVLDWPIQKLEVMEKNYGSRLYKVYVQPDDTEELGRRLARDERDADGKRYLAGVQELNALESGAFDGLFDLKITNQKDHDKEVAQCIYDSFILSLGS